MRRTRILSDSKVKRKIEMPIRISVPFEIEKRIRRRREGRKQDSATIDGKAQISKLKTHYGSLSVRITVANECASVHVTRVMLCLINERRQSLDINF